MILVSGATGLLGGEVCRLLAEAGKPVRALVRPTADTAKIENLKSLGVSLVEADLKDSSSLDEACRGVDSIISTASSTFSRQEGDSIQTVDNEGQIRLVDAAKKAGVKRFVFVSFRNDPAVQYPLTVAKRAVETHLKESGLGYTILQASWFMEIWLSPAVGFDYANAQAQIYGEGQNKISWVSFKDVAKFALASLGNASAENAVIEVGGPEPLSPLEVVRTFEDVGSIPFTVSHVSKEQLETQMAGATDALQESFAGLMIQYANGDAIDMGETANAYQVQLTSVRDYASSVLGG